MNIVIDLETCPSQDPSVRADIAAAIDPPGNISKAETIALWHIEKKPIAVEEAWRKTSFDGATGHICVIGVAFDDEPPIALYYDDWHANESQLLADFAKLIDDRCTSECIKPTFIGHNLVEFDLRFLFQRSVVLNVKPSRYIPFAAKPWDDGIYDTMIRWAGLKAGGSMAKICKALGIDGKGDIDGSKVWNYVEAGRIAEVAEYCKGDISRTLAMYKRFNFL